MNKYDLIIIGLGPAALSASIYASRYGVKHALIGVIKGGTASEAHIIENYPGYKSIVGNELMKKFLDHAQEYKPEIIQSEVEKITKKNDLFQIKTFNKTYQSKSLIIALGIHHRQLSIPGEKIFLGKGISYCPACDGHFFKNKIVAVIGGGDAALTSSLYLSRIAKKIYLIHRRKEFRGQIIWQKRVLQNKKIIPVLNREVKSFEGKIFLEKIILNKPFQLKKELAVNGVFIQIGTIPSGKNIKLDFPLNLKRNKEDYIIVNRSQETNIPGLFAAGDITGPPEKLRQIITAAAEGAIAAVSAQRFLTKKG